MTERSGKAAVAAVAQIIAYAAIYSLFSRAWAGDDEETEENNMDKLSDYERDHQLQLWDPLDLGSGRHMKLHIPYGLNVPFSIGRRIADVIAHSWSGGEQGTTALEASASIMNSSLDVLNPLGSAGNFWVTLMPHPVRPLMNLNTTKVNFMGNPIYPQKVGYGPSKTEAFNHFNSVNPISRSAAQAWSKALGGDKYQEPLGGDWFTVNPETIDELWGFFFGGFGRQVYNGVGEILRPYLGNESFKGWGNKNIPIVQAFYKDSLQDFNLDRKYFDVLEAVQRTDRQFKAYREAGNSDAAREYLDKNKGLLQLGKMVKNLEKRRQYWKRKKSAAKGSGSQLIEKSAEKDLRKGKAALVRKAYNLGINP